MIRYQYLAQIRPPAPFIYVAIRNPITGAAQLDVTAQRDTAADRTVIPASLVTSLVLPQIGAIAIGGVGGIVLSMPSYPIEVSIHQLGVVNVEVVASSEENWILLGRDVLNTLRVLLDGPQLAVELG